MSTNKEVILIDQNNKNHKMEEVDNILSYMIARFDFGKSLYLNFSKSYIFTLIRT